MKRIIHLIGCPIMLTVWLAGCSFVSVEDINAAPTIHTDTIVPSEDNFYTETTNLVPKNDYEYYKEQLSQLFPFPDANFQNYDTIRGSLDIESTEGNYFSATFLNDDLKSYELTIFGETGKSEYSFFVNDGFMFLHYILTEYTAPYVTNDAKEYATRFVAENDELLIYDYINEEIMLSALTNDEQQRIFNSALDFEQKILNGAFQKEDWVDAFANLIENGNIPGHFQKIILIDIDFDGIPELFLTMSSITGGNRPWIHQGFAYQDGVVVDIKCSLPINLELYRDIETNALTWIADGVDFNLISNPIIEHSYDHYWKKVDFSNVRKAEWSEFFHWREEFTTIWDVADSQSESVFTLIGYFDHDRIMSKKEIDELQNDVFSHYELIDTVRVVGDAQRFGLVNYTTIGEEFPRDELLAFLRSYDEF